jgi:acyl-CoA synthetase (AMP-forming)/AMP-acid ligase II
MFYRWEPSVSPAESEFGLVPIGEPYPEMRVLVVDGDLREVEPGDPGELLLCGSQVTPGYWNDPAKTAAAFVRPPGHDAIHYRTGDLVRRPHGSAPVTYLGRVDHQIKINGYRVELGEVEETLRRASGLDEVVAIGWPRTASGASAITAFVGAPSIDAGTVRAQMAEQLPDYMVPREIVALESLPLNANGKYDRNALAEGLAAHGLDPATVPNDLDLFAAGVVDSFGLLELIVSLEERFGGSLDFEELEVDDLTVLGPFCNYVSMLLADQVAAAEAAG